MTAKRLLCFFGLHDWSSILVGEIPAQTIAVGSVIVTSTRRIVWDNSCRRCGRFVGLTYRYAETSEVELVKSAS